MRTYWAYTDKGGSFKPKPHEFGRLYLDSKDYCKQPDFWPAIEVAVVPAAALKRLVEACQDAVDTYTYQSDNAGEVFAGPNVVREIRDALSEWKGGAE